jgi:putative salt-induced outer membrane protein YdiY
MLPGGRAALLALLAVALLAWPRAAHAQIVNVQSLLGQDVAEGFSGNLDAGADWRTGNTELLLVQGAATLRYKHEDHLVFAIVRGAYSRVGTGADEEQIIGNTFEHLRYRWKLTPRLTAEAFGQHEYDEFRRLQLRALVGVGPRVTLSEQKSAGLVVGVAYMFEYQELDRKVDAIDAGRTESTSRLSSYLMFTSALNEVVTFVDTVYYQPSLERAGDFRVLDETQLQVKLTEHFTFKTAFVLAHDSAPPLTVESTDTALQTGVSFKF